MDLIDSPDKFSKIEDHSSSSSEEESEIMCGDSPKVCKQAIKETTSTSNTSSKLRSRLFPPVGPSSSFVTPQSASVSMSRFRHRATDPLSTPKTRKRKSLPASSIKQLFQSPSKLRKCHSKLKKVDATCRSTPNTVPTSLLSQRVRKEVSYVPERENDSEELKIGEFMSPSKLQRIYDFEIIPPEESSEILSTSSNEGEVVESQTITQISSSTCDDEFSSTLEGNTPISDWLIKPRSSVLDRTTGDTSRIEITQFDSPQKESMRIFEAQALARRRPLAEQMKRILSRYNSSLRAFMNPRRIKNEKNDINSRIFFVSSCFPADNPYMVWAWAYDIESENNQWILFRNTCSITGSKLGSEVATGCCVKLYLPWKEISVSKSEDNSKTNVLICTDFYEVLNPTKIGMTKDDVQRIRLSSKCDLTGCITDAGEESLGLALPQFLNIVPYSLRNPFTILKQTNTHCHLIELHARVCKLWGRGKHRQIILKDSDEMFSLLETDSISVINSLLNVGECVELKGLEIVQKITPNDLLPFFSVMTALGSSQRVYYTLSVTEESTCITNEDIPISKLENVICEEVDLCDILKISFLSDRRVALRVKFVQFTHENSLVCDPAKESSTARIWFFETLKPHTLISEGEIVLINFVRVFRGRMFIDTFSEVKLDKKSEFKSFYCC